MKAKTHQLVRCMSFWCKLVKSDTKFIRQALKRLPVDLYKQLDAHFNIQYDHKYPRSGRTFVT